LNFYWSKSVFTNRPAKNSHPSIETQTRTTTAVPAPSRIDGLNTDVYLIRDRVQRKLLNETDGDINSYNNGQLHQIIEKLIQRCSC